MKISLRLLLSLLLLSFSVAAFAGTQTINFDDLPDNGSGNGAFIPNGYAGLDWNNIGYVNGNDATLAGTGYQNGIVSCCNVAFDAFGSGGSFVSAMSGTFQLDSAYFTAAGSDQTGEVQAFLGGVMVGDFLFPELGSQPTFIDFGGITVDKVQIIGTGDQNVFDDLTITTADQVPEPTSLLLLGSGVLALGTKLRSRVR